MTKARSANILDALATLQLFGRRGGACSALQRNNRDNSLHSYLRKSILNRIRTASALLALIATLTVPAPSRAQDGKEADPAAALTSALTAACKQNELQFAIYLTADNAAAFKNLSADQRTTVLHRFALVDSPGKPLLSNDADGHAVVRCEAAAGTAELRFGATRVRENLAFIPIRSGNTEPTEFGLVRESGGWRLLSVGILMFDVAQLAERWAEQDLQSHEDSAANILLDLGDAIDRYHDAYGQLPEKLAQLGPAPKNEVSPDLANLIPADVASGQRGGYRYKYRVIDDADGNATSYELAATPEQYGKTGRRSFLLDSSKKLHGADKHGDLATAEDPIVETK